MANNSLKILHLNSNLFKVVLINLMVNLLVNNAEVAGCQELGKALQSNSSIEELSLNGEFSFERI